MSDSVDKPQPRSSVTMEDIRQMMSMVKEFQVDEFEIAGIKIKKSVHAFPEKQGDVQATKPISDEDALYFSAQ